MTTNIPPRSLKYFRSSNDDSSEAKRWLIIGAHQAGASEKRVARISGLSKTAVRHIILNYQRTGNPCLPKREPKKVKERPLVEYDEDGNLIISDDENDNDNLSTCSKKLTDTTATTAKKRRSSKLNSKVSTKDLLEFMMEQVKRMEREETPIPTSFSSSSPSTDHQVYHDTWISSSSSFLALSPPPTSSTKSTSSDSTYHQYASDKYNQTIRGYELWTQEDDMMLLQHILTRLRLGNWRELEMKFKGRHTARLCNARWNYLRAHLLKGIDQADASLW